MKIGVIGGGAWGTALAQVAAAGGESLLWAREEEVVASINEVHENSLFLAGVPLDPAIRAAGHLAELGDCEALLVVTPAQHMRAVLGALPPLAVPLILCAKGMEESSQKLMDEVRTFADLSSNIVKEIELKREGEWSKRLMAERVEIGKVMETFMDRAPKEIAVALPMAKGTGADFSKPCGPEKKEMAIRYARLVAGSRNFAAAASFAAKLGSSLDCCGAGDGGLL